MTRTLTAIGGAVALFAAVAAAAALYAASGGGARDDLVTVLLIDLILVVGLQVFTGNSGVLSFGHLAFAAVAGYTAAILAASAVVKHTTIPDAPFGLADVELGVLPAVLLAIGAAVVAAAVIGLAVTRIAGLAAAIVTLGLLIVVRSVLLNYGSLTGGAEALYGFPSGATDRWVWAVALAAIVVARLFRSSSLGLRLQASREDELAAGATGIDVVRVRYAAWVLSAAIVGAGGALRVFFLGAVNPEEFFLHLTFLTLAMLIVGGMRSVTGAVVGTVAVTVGSELFRTLGGGPTLLGVDLPQLPGLTQLFLGGVILAVMLLRPAGLVGDREVDDALQRRSRPRADEATPDRGTRAAQPLEVIGVSKRYGRLQALDDVTLDVRPGEILGLIGPNGAGKTTVINVITGMVAPDAGEVRLGGGSLLGTSPQAVARAGVARTFQNIRLFGALSVRDNLAVAAGIAARHRADVPGPDLHMTMDRFALTAAADQRAAALPYGEQRQLEMARAVLLRPDVLLLDEPAAGMNTAETQWLLGVIKGVRDAQGCGVLVIDHDLHFILNLCDRIVVLNSGKVIATGTPEEVRTDPAVIEAYLGSGADQAGRRPQKTSP